MVIRRRPPVLQAPYLAMPGSNESLPRRKALTRTVDLKIVRRPILEVKLDLRETRRHTKAKIRKLAKGLLLYGFLVPVLVDKYGNVIAGHARVLAATYNGDTEVPTIGVDHLSPEEVRALKIFDNRISELSEWDEVALALEIKELAEINLDLVLDGLGFEAAEIDLKIQSIGEGGNGETDGTDKVQVVARTAVAKMGDVFQLGTHITACGSALDREIYRAIFGSQRASIVITDPPYDVPIKGHVSVKGQHREFVMASGEMGSPKFLEFLRSGFRLMAQYSIDGSIHYVFMDWRHAEEILSAAKDVYTEFKNLCVWVKDNGGMGSLYRSQHELVFVFKNGEAAHHNNVQLGRFGRYRTNVWHYPGANSFARSTEEGNLTDLHPTVKPVKLIADAILDCSVRGEIVLDPFLGSGTTLLAAERTGRRCYGLELDPLYIDVAIRRWQAYTGGQAIHVSSGKTFDQLASEVCDGE